MDPKPKVDPKQKKGELVWGSKTAKMAPTARAERSTTGRKRPAGQSQQTQKRTSSGQNQQQRAKTRATSAPSFGAPPHRSPLQHADSSRHKKRKRSWLSGDERKELNEDASSRVKG